MDPERENEYQDTIGLLAVSFAGHTLGLTSAAGAGKPAETVQPSLVALANVVMPKLP